MKSPRALCTAFFLLAFGSLLSQAWALPKADKPGTPLAPFAKPRIAPQIALAFRPRLDSGAPKNSRRILEAAGDLPLLIEFSSRPSAGDLQELGALGFEIDRRRDGKPRGYSNTIVARANRQAIETLLNPTPQGTTKTQKIPKIQKIRWDGSPFRAPPPLDNTAKEIQAGAAWQSSLANGQKLRGEGIVICDIDTGIDIFHPLFFKADGGYRNWKDNDENGVLNPGTDTVDGIVLKTLNSAIMEYYGEEPLFGSDNPGYQPGSDWLYADLNGNGVRDYGPGQGFSESDPAYGEPLFTGDDINKNGLVDAGEKLVLLKTSKVRSVRFGKKIYRRGNNLIQLPNNPEAAHGTSSASVMVGGHVGLTRFVGIAPEAEIVVGALEEMGTEVALADFCVDEGARVVLHEYAPWLGYHLDGSSPMEALIDKTALEGISHINPAGNLSTSQKLYKRTILAGTQTDVSVEVPKDSPWGDFYFMGLSLLWRDIPTNLGLTLEDPTGFSMPVLGANPYEYILSDWPNGLKYFAVREDSDRGTARVDIYLYNESANPVQVPAGIWTLHVNEPNPAGNKGLELIAFTMDDISGWGQGIYFPEYSNEDHLIGYPGTADHGLAVSAYTGNGYWGDEPGLRAAYSGRGHRIDGQSLLWIAAPDDPIAAGYRENNPALYTIFGGTSGASPHVAGAAALLIQADPSRSGLDVRDALAKGALADVATQAVPNDEFGYGKLRIYQSLFSKDPPPGINPSIMVKDSIVFVGQESAVAVEVNGNQSDEIVLDVDWDYDGVYDELLEDAVLRRVFQEEGVVFVKVRATDQFGREGTALGRLTVQKAPLVPGGEAEKPIEYLAVGGGACAISGHGAPQQHWIGYFLGSMAIWAGRRRRRF